VAYRQAAAPMTLGDFQGHPCIAGLIQMFVQLCSSWRWEDFTCHRASRGPSARAEHRVWICHCLASFCHSSYEPRQRCYM